MKVPEGSWDEFELSNGRRFYAHGLTLCPGAPELFMARTTGRMTLTYGSDGTVSEDRPVDEDTWRDDPPFTDAERREIAEYMIARWNAWAGK